MTTIEATRSRKRGRARWEDALDAQLEAYLFTGSDRGRSYLAGWKRAATTKAERYSDVIVAGVDRLRDALYEAEPFHIDPDMQTLWEASVDGFTEEPLEHDDVLTDIGFVYLPRPHHMVDVHGKDVSTRAFLWHGATFRHEYGVVGPDGSRLPGVEQHVDQSGLVIYALHRLGDVDDYDDGSAAQVPNVMRHRVSDLAGYGILKTGDLIVDHIYPWTFGTPAPGSVGSKPTPLTKHLQALLRLMQQHIALRSQGRPERRLRRRMARADLPVRSIVIVRLRRPDAPSDPEHRAVEWSHRWLVSGHWRNQYYPSTGTHRQVFINPYIKGPPDAPLEVRKTRVFDWSR